MKEIKRYKITSANGNSSNVAKCDDGHWVNYADVKQLQARIKELESQSYINEIKAQGIKEFIEIETEKSIKLGNNAIFRSYVMVRIRLCAYFNKLRAKHD